MDSLLANPSSLNPADKFIDKNAAVDADGHFMFAGDPEAKDLMDDENSVDIHPDADSYIVVRAGNKKFNFSVTQIREPINAPGSAGERAYGYAFDFDRQNIT